jgi:hypothetical protein
VKKTLFAIVAAALLTLPAACVHPYAGHHGRYGGPGGAGCPKQSDCGCKQKATECKCPDCGCKKGGECKCGHQQGGPQEQHQHEQAPPAK